MRGVQCLAIIVSDFSEALDSSAKDVLMGNLGYLANIAVVVVVVVVVEQNMFFRKAWYPRQTLSV